MFHLLEARSDHILQIDPQANGSSETNIDSARQKSGSFVSPLKTPLLVSQPIGVFYLCTHSCLMLLAAQIWRGLAPMELSTLIASE
jgi:hypothetical protein